MKTIAKLFIAVLISLILVTGFSNDNIKASGTVVAVQEVSSNLRIVYVLFNGMIYTYSMDSGHTNVGDLF
ncbi:hypothetical protein BH10BAC5_BH10BAC5_17640 [soil metagenome]